jgi:hypothetical protein
MLLAHGADPNARSQIGHTALGLACHEGYSSCVRLLLEAGADLAMNSMVFYARDGFVERTPLQIAAEARHPQVRPCLDMPVALFLLCTVQLDEPLSWLLLS